MKLSPNQKIDVREVLQDLEHYRPRRKGWTWRKKIADQQIGAFVYKIQRRISRSLFPCLLPTILMTLIPNAMLSSLLKSPPVVSKTIFGACVWRLGMALTILW